MSWRNNLQTASYRGIPFDVKDIDDSNTKALVLHQYAYKDGADIEDLGNDAEEVTLTAVFWGNDYEVRFNQLLKALATKGGGTLVHPVRGRMPNMHPSSYHFTHEAENIDYVRFSITFRKSINELPIFSLSSIFSVIDSLFNQAENLIALATDYFNAFRTSINEIKSYRARVRAIEASLINLNYEIQRLARGDNELLFASNSGKYAESGFDDEIVTKLSEGITTYIDNSTIRNSALPNVELNALQTSIDVLEALPIKIGKGDSRLDLGVPIAIGDVTEINIMFKALLNAVYITKITEIISEDRLSVIEIENIVNHARTLTASTIEAIRGAVNNPDEVYIMVQSLRDIQHDLKRLAISYIAKKPPLIVIPAPISGTLQQIAFDLYQNHYRFNELLQLNPQIVHSNFIQQGALLNAYSE